MLSILQFILKILARITLGRYQPIVVGVTGSVGKTSTKEAIHRVLRKHFRTRRNIKSYNNELGVPLTILGIETGGRSFWVWLKRFLKALLVILGQKDYPEILVLEMGVDKPNDMKYLLNFVPVKVGVFTAIGQFPSHLEFFPEKEELIKEKARLIQALPKDGLAILNYDDLSVRMIGEDLSQEIKSTTYGFGEGAQIQISNFAHYFPGEDEDFDRGLIRGQFGISFKLEYQGSVVPIKLRKVLGKQQAYSAAAAAAVGLFFGLNLVEISHALRAYRSVVGRTNLIRGIKRTWLIDDSYNASPLAVLAALDVLDELAKSQDVDHPRRKIAVLGDMLELGEDTEAGHRQVGEKAAQITDMLFTIGARAVFIADEAAKQGLSKEKIFKFDTSEEAGLVLQEKMEEGDVVLIKGSRSMRLEKVTQEVMSQPEKAAQLLVQ